MAANWNRWWPDVSDLNNAERAANEGAGAALFVAGVTAIVAALALSLSKPIIGIDGWGLVDAAIFGAIALGTYRKYRSAAVCGLALFIVERVYMLATQPPNGGALVVGMFFLLGFINGVRGTFAYHKLTPRQTEEPGIASDQSGPATAAINSSAGPSVARNLTRYFADAESTIFKVVAVITVALSTHVVLAERPFSFLFAERYIDQTVIQESVVNVLCSSEQVQSTGGSGTMLTVDGVVITNSHIIPQDQQHILTIDSGCLVILPNTTNGQPNEMYWAKPIVLSGLSDKYDLAYLRIVDAFVDDKGNKRGTLPRTFTSIFGSAQHYDDICRLSAKPKLADPIRIYGYPQTSGGFDLTVTDGIVSSLSSEGVMLTSAKVDAGNSGGLAVDKKGCMVGIPTAVSEGKYQNLGVITTTDRVIEFSEAVEKLNASK